jgi:hypothetical protein
MGDQASQPSAPAEPPRQDAAAVTMPASVQTPSHAATAEYPSSIAASHLQHQHTFTSQLGMIHQQRMAPFDMSAMANTLPQYRPQPYGHPPPRYTAAPTQLPAAQYVTPNTMGAMSAQPYYVPHHAQMGHFYQTPMSPQPPSTMPPRPDLGYYTSPVAMPQAPHTGAHFYYTPEAAYTGHIPHAQGQVGFGHHGLPNLHQHPDAGSRQPQHGGQGANAASPSPQGNGKLRHANWRFAVLTLRCRSGWVSAKHGPGTAEEAAAER